MFWYRLFQRKLHDWRDQGVAFVSRLVRRRTPPPVEDASPKVNPVASVLAAGLVPPVSLPHPRDESVPYDVTTPTARIKLNRKERRSISALERARRKHDKFVEPKGEMLP